MPDDPSEVILEDFGAALHAEPDGTSIRFTMIPDAGEIENAVYITVTRAQARKFGRDIARLARELAR